MSRPKSLGHLVAEPGSEPVLGAPISITPESPSILERKCHTIFKSVNISESHNSGIKRT